MSTEQELVAQITALGDQIKAAKQANKPKEEWDPILQEMLAAKAKFKEMTGKDYGPPKQEKKMASEQQQQQQQAPSEKNKEKRAAKAAAKAAREAEKAAKRAERERREKEKADRLAGKGQENFGDVPLVQSQTPTTNKIWTAIENLKPALAGEQVLVRGHLQTTRAVGKGVFVLVRSSLYSVQGVAFETKDGFLIIAVNNDGQFERFCKLADREDLLADAQFATNPDRVRNRDVVVREVAKIMKTRTSNDRISKPIQVGM